jgi:hypothetical protein
LQSVSTPMRSPIVLGALVSRHGLNQRPPI